LELRQFPQLFQFGAADPDLAVLVGRWPNIPVDIKVSILAMVRAEKAAR
jgi:hypothetical protein